MYVHKLIVKEVLSIPQILESIESKLGEIEKVAQKIVNENIDRIVLTGCGSSFYAALKSSYPLISTNLKSYTLPTSELLWILSSKFRRGLQKSAILVFSRSGETAEVKAFVEASKESNGGVIIGVTCNPDSFLARFSDRSISMSECMEDSAYMTKSFISLSLIGTLISLKIIESIERERRSNIENHLRNLLEVSKDLVSDFEIYEQFAGYLQKKSPIIVLGSEDLYSLALEAALKFIEVSYTNAIGLHALEFRHGYTGLLENSDLAAIVLSNSERPSYKSILKLINELKSFNKTIVHISNTEKADYYIPIKGDSYIETIAYIIPIYLIAVIKAIRSGHDPDKPKYIAKIVSEF